MSSGNSGHAFVVGARCGGRPAQRCGKNRLSCADLTGFLSLKSATREGRKTRKPGGWQVRKQKRKTPPGLGPDGADRNAKRVSLQVLMVVGPHPLSNPANWARFSCQWLLRTSEEPTNLAGSLSEADCRSHRKLRTSIQIRVAHLNRRPHCSP